MFEPATFLKTSHISGILFWVTDWNFGNHDPIILTSLPQVFWHFYVLIFKEHQTMAGASLLWVLRNNVWNQVAEFLCHIHIEATNIISVGFFGGGGGGVDKCIQRLSSALVWPRTPEIFRWSKTTKTGRNCIRMYVPSCALVKRSFKLLKLNWNV
jgi:hypothetical protein